MEISSYDMERQDIINKFKQMETELNLFDLEILEVKVWQYLRFQILSKILVKTNIQTHAHDTVDNKYLKAFFKNVGFIFKNRSLFFQRKNNKEVLIFNNSRRRQINGDYWAIYTDFLLDKANFDYQAIEIPSMTIPLESPKIKSTIYLDYGIIALRILIERFKINKFQKYETKELNNISNKIESEFNVNINLVLEVKNIVKLRKAFLWYFNVVLKKFNPKIVVEVVSYAMENMVLNELCKQKKITTIEMQHGVINQFHLAYDFPKKIDLDIFPDYFFSFGKYWKDILNLPIPDANIVPVGFPFFEEQYKKYKLDKQHKKEERILFISQGTIGKDLSKFAHDLAKLTNKEIVYKLHPGEYKRWKNDYNYLQKRSNITVIDHNDIPLYQLFAESTVLIGVYSTAIYESLPFELEIFIVKLPGYETTNQLINLGFAALVSTPKELVQNLKLTNLISEDFKTDYFFQRDSVENQKKAITRILKNKNKNHS